MALIHDTAIRWWHRLALVLSIVFVGAALPACDSEPTDDLEERASEVRVSMAKEEVLALLGRPDEIEDHRGNMRGQRCFSEFRYWHQSSETTGWWVCFDEQDRVLESRSFFMFRDI